MSLTPPDPVSPGSDTPHDEESRLLAHRAERRPASPPASTRPENIFDRINRARREGAPRRHPLHPRTRRLLRRVARVGGVLVVLCLVAAIVYALTLRHALTASLPQLDGSLHVAGLSSTVTVARDSHGVPSIQAANLDDLLFAQGFVTSQDRLWQMDALRRHAAGELAEILGAKLIPHDRTQRTLRLRAAADRALGTLPPDQLHQLEAYARGVNAFIESPATHLPVEFSLLGYRPRPWTPRDSLLVSLAMNQDLATEYPTKLARETLAGHLAPELMADLYPVGSWRDHPPGEAGPDRTSPKPEILQIPHDHAQSRLRPPSVKSPAISLPAVSPQDLLEARATTFQQTCEGCRSGSNNWAVAGRRSASGMPLVSNDMHLALALPDIWYEASLYASGGTLDVTGLSLPGTPFIIVGRNAHIAWGFTNLLADVQDVYIEHTRASGADKTATEFQHPDGSWSPVEHHAELIRVKGGRDVNLDVETTTHAIGDTTVETPIITPLYPSEHRTLALLWNVYDPSTLTEPFYAADIAANGTALAAALQPLGGPSLSVVYADDENHIGFHALGRIPIRGPAIQHAIAPPADLPTSNGNDPDDDDDNAGDSARLAPDPSSLAARLTLAAFRPRRRRSGPEAVSAPTAASRRLRPIPKSPPAPAKNAVDTGVPAPPPPPHYTIGSPIPSVPVDSSDLAAVWSGYIPYEALPTVTDPASGVLATANARVTPDGYPYAITSDWISPYRVERINKLLSTRTGLTPADMLRTQMDIHSELDLALAHRLAYALDQTARRDDAHPTKRLLQAADLLRSWNGEVTANSVAANIVSATRADLLGYLIAAKVAEHDKALGEKSAAKPEELARLYSWGESSYALEQLVLLEPARWLPNGVANWNDLLTASVTRGLAAHAPSDLTHWGYGKSHPVEISHPVLSASPLLGLLLDVRTGSGPQVVGGDTSTVKSTARSYGPSERFTADLANPAATTSNITTGQSANPRSPWYLDQLPLWLGGQTLPLPLHATAAAHTLVLQP